jgi:metallo-beta-lactamase class B
MRLLALLAIPFAVAVHAESTPPASADTCRPGAKWTEPATPRKIYGNTFFVGTCGLSAILVTSDQGHVLIDGGVEEDAPLIEANVRALGFKLDDVRYILNSHEHFDHAGGIAALQRDTHATVIAREPAAAAFERGHGDRTDPQFLSAKSYPSIANVRRIADGGTVTLGAIELTAHATPAHTPGSTTWTWTSCEQKRCLHIVYADSLSAISDDVFRYSDNTTHPGVLDAFRRSIATIEALPCDILVTPHPDASDLWNRLGPAASAPLIDTGACRRYGAGARRALDERIAREKGAATP